MDATRRRRWTVAAWSLVALVVVFGIYLGWLNWKLTEAIVAAPWRHPVEIVSSARGAGSEPIVRLYGDDWRVTEPVRVADLPEHVSHAFLAAEDVRFYRHPGIDPIGIARAAFTNVKRGGVAEGGSTITQQLIKQKLFTNERSLRRKVPEMMLAVLLTLRMSKEDVLEGYINEVYLGEFAGAPVYGIDEASHVFFDKKPNDLTPDEAALIAGIVRAPNRDNPVKRPDRARERRDSILEVMRDAGWLTPDDYEEAIEREIRLSEGTLPNAPWGHYLSALRTELSTLRRPIPKSGITIVCHLDPSMQEAAEDVAMDGTRALKRRSRHLARRDDLQIAILSADPKSGAVRALVGSRDFGTDTFDRTRRMKRQPGSALKPFVYATALETREFTATTPLSDTPMRVELARNRSWSPRNYDERFRGDVALRVALEQSLNVPTVRLAEDVGLAKIERKLRRFGFREDFEQVPSLPLGVADVTLRELVAAYSAFPSLGTVPELHLVSEVRDRRGRTIYKRRPRTSRAVDPPVAWLTHDLLRGVVLRGTASRLAGGGFAHMAGKTGTTTDYRDAWFVGYAPDLVTGLWVGTDGGAPLRLSASEAAVPLWSAYMDRVETSTAEIPPPDGIVFRDIDPTDGLLWRPGCSGPVREAFLQGTEPERDCRSGGGRMLAALRGDPEPPEISDETWRRWNGEPIVRRTEPRVTDRDRDIPRRRSAIVEERPRRDDSREFARRDTERRADKREERLRKNERKAAERMRKEREKEQRKRNKRD